MPYSAKIILVCDDLPYGNYIRDEISSLGDYEPVMEKDSPGGLKRLKEEGADLVFLKYGMPDMEIGLFLKEAKKIDPDCVFVLLCEQAEPGKAQDFFDSGIYDIIKRPFSKERLGFILDKGIKLHSLLVSTRKLNQGLRENTVALEKQNTLLAKRIEDSTKNLSRLYEDLRSTYMRTIRVLAQAIDARDHYTHSHSENVAKYAVAIATHLNLPAKEIEMIRQACELHDLGKIGIEDSILLKPSGLTPQEWEQIKKHPSIGAQILEPLTFLGAVVELVRQHHEHYDGTGYPEGRRGEDILLGARIINLADAYEAMRSPRSYRKEPFSKEEAILEIKRNSGTQFDPKIVDAFLKIVNNL